MKRSPILILLIVSSLVFWLAGCSARPTAQIERTAAAYDQAKAEEAAQFSPEEWKAADEAYSDAKAAVDAENWGQATTLLLKAETRFKKARDIAKGKREFAIKEVSDLKTTAEKRCQTLRENVEKNSARLGSKRKPIDEACKLADESIAKIGVQLENKRYNDAKFLAQTTLREIWEAEKALDAALGGKK